MTQSRLPLCQARLVPEWLQASVFKLATVLAGAHSAACLASLLATSVGRWLKWSIGLTGQQQQQDQQLHLHLVHSELSWWGLKSSLHLRVAHMHYCSHYSVGSPYQVVNVTGWGVCWPCANSMCASCWTPLRTESDCGGASFSCAVCLCVGHGVELHVQDRW
jgi:hypothetical protein